MTDKKNNNKKYTSAVRRELKRIVRRKLWRGFLVAGVDHHSRTWFIDYSQLQPEIRI